MIPDKQKIKPNESRIEATEFIMILDGWLLHVTEKKKRNMTGESKIEFTMKEIL